MATLRPTPTPSISTSCLDAWPGHSPHGRQELAKSLEDKIETVRFDETGELNGSVNPFDVPSVVVDLIENATWKERLAAEDISPTPADRTIGAQVDRYLALEQVRTRSDQLSISEFDTIRRCLHAFRDHIGKSNPVQHPGRRPLGGLVV